MCDDVGQGGVGSELLIESFATPLSLVSQEEETDDQFTNISFVTILVLDFVVYLVIFLIFVELLVLILNSYLSSFFLQHINELNDQINYNCSNSFLQLIFLLSLQKELLFGVKA
jgi:hypothetical protein